MRIYKGSEITLRLYNPCKIEDGLVDVILYTTNPKLAYKVKDATVEGNIVYVKIDKSTFNNMEDGVINYIILDEVYNTERQSSYYLKTPEDYVAKSVQSSKNIDIVDNGDYKILPDEDYSSIEEVNVHVEFDAEHYYQEGYETGKAYQKSKLESVSITENGTYTREDGYNEITVDVPDLNGDYNEGYDAGKVDGYDSGYTAGEVEQKSKLTNITISENGTYTRENGYNTVVVNVEDTNGSYDEGYQAGIDYASENAEEIAAANAIDLVATKFGTYYTKYSDNIVNPNPVTGIYPDGETFHNLVETNKVFDTGIFANETTKLEFWVEFLNTNNNSSFSILSNSLNLYLAGGGWGFAKSTASMEKCDVCVGGAGTIDIKLKFNKLYHIELSFSDGLIIDGEQIGTFSNSGNKNQTLLLNGWKDQTFENVYNRFGMIKITTDGITNVIIPTENGFLNTTTNQLLEVVKDFDTYKYINNDPIILDNLIKSVDVQPKVDIAKYGIKFGRSTFAEVPDFYDFSNVTDYYYMFFDCGALQKVPELDTSNVTNMEGMFNGCKSLQTIPELDTSNVTNMGSMFYNCGSLETIPELDTSNVTNMDSMFYKSPNLISIPPLNANKLTFGYNGLFYFTTMNKLTDFGGLIGFKSKANNDYTFVRCPNLTYQSCINILNGLYDFAGNGETPASNQGQLKVHPNFLTTVGDEISIGVLKGWSIQS